MPQAPSVVIPHRWPLIVGPENRDETTLKDARLINAYVETNQQTGEQWVYKRPGLSQYGTIVHPGVGRGIYNWQGSIYTVFGATLYKDGSAIGTVGIDSYYRFSSALGATPRLVLGNGLTAYCWDGATLTQISGVNFPGGSSGYVPRKGWAYLDGTTYVIDTKANIHGSDTTPGMNRPDLWTDSLNILGAQMEPDPGVFIIKQLAYVLVLKEWSTEVFYDAFNPPGASPLGPVQGAKLNFGCVHPDSVQEIDGILVWLATNRASGTQIIAVENLKPVVISTKAIERILGETLPDTIFAFVVKYKGHRFYGLTLATANITLVYDLTEHHWAQWTDTDGNYFPLVGMAHLSNTSRVFQHATNGKLYSFDAQYWNDAGDIITVDLYTPNFDAGFRRRKQLNMMEFVGDQVAGSTLQVRTNDFDYDTTKWTNFRQVDMSVKRPLLANCGTFYRRALHIRHQSNTALRLQAVELQLDIGTL